MNKEEFLKTLDQNLSKLPDEEREAALQYYEEYLYEAGSENELETIKRLGNPTQIAKQLMADFVAKEIETKPLKAKQSFQAFWIVIVALFASPIAFPIAISIAAVAFAAIVTVMTILFTISLVTVVFLVTSLVLGITGIMKLFIHPATAAVSIGASCVLLGFGILASVLIYVIVRNVIPTIMKKIIEICHKAKGGK